jgi:hypothetical protein
LNHFICIINGIRPAFLTQNGVFCAAGFAFSMGKQPFEQGLDGFGTVTVQGKQSCVPMHPYLPPAYVIL